MCSAFLCYAFSGFVQKSSKSVAVRFCNGTGHCPGSAAAIISLWGGLGPSLPVFARLCLYLNVDATKESSLLAVPAPAGDLKVQGRVYQGILLIWRAMDIITRSSGMKKGGSLPPF